MSRASDSISDLAIEPKGALWVMGNYDLYYWTGTKFAKPNSDATSSGPYLVQLWGGGDRPLYATQFSDDWNGQDGPKVVAKQGRVLRLSDGTASFVTNFSYEVPHHYPGIHITKAGHIINWGRSFVASFDGADWNRHAADLGREVSLVETNDAVHLLSGNHVFTIDGKGKLTSRELGVPPDTPWYQPTLWGENRLIVLYGRSIRRIIFELPEFKRIELGDASRVLADFQSGVMLRTPDGSVLFDHHPPGDYGQHVLYRLSPGGTVEAINSGNFPARSASYLEPWLKPVLFAKDGATWLLSENRGILSFQDGKLQRYGCREGLADGGARAIVQDDAGNIYAGFHHGVWMMPADGRRTQLPEWMRVWTEHPLAAARPVQDDSNKLWMALTSKPKAISCWDGNQFVHRAVPFDTSRIQLFLVDDQEHLLVVLNPTKTGAIACHDVGPQDSSAYSSLEEMLVAAVKRGVKKFNSNNDLSGPVVDQYQRIWYAIGGRITQQIRLYNGTKWLGLDGYSYVYPTTTGEVLVSTNERLARYDLGVLLPLEPHPYFCMFGPDALTPYHPAIFMRAPQNFLLAEDGGRNFVQVAYDPDDLTKPWKVDRTQQQPTRVGYYVTRGRFGSHWMAYCACDLHRMFAGRAYLSDFTFTPVDAQSYITSNMFDDARGNLWIHRGTWGHGGNSMFMKDTSRFQLKPLKLPATIPSISLHTVAATDALGKPIEPKLFWKIDDGVWIQGQQPGKLALTFDQPGKHRVRVLAIGKQAEFCREPLDFTCEVHDGAANRGR